jgi:hypothetical protein
LGKRALGAGGAHSDARGRGIGAKGAGNLVAIHAVGARGARCAARGASLVVAGVARRTLLEGGGPCWGGGVGGACRY